MQVLNNRSLSASVLIAVCALVFSVPGKAASLNDDLRSKYQGKVVMLRNFYCGRDLKFDAQGELLGGGRAGAWTLCRDIRITHIDIRDRQLKISGQRIYLARGSKQTEFQDVTANEPDEAKRNKRFKDLFHNQEVSIEAQLLPNADAAGIQGALDRLFYTSEQEFSEALPDLWKCFFPTKGEEDICSMAPKSRTTQLTDSQVERVGGGVKAPRALQQPDPSFDDEARMAKFQGVTVLNIVVDRVGEVKQVRVTRPLGMGLDEQAAATVSTWKFAPAEREGKPVAVQVSVEVSFNLY